MKRKFLNAVALTSVAALTLGLGACANDADDKKTKETKKSTASKTVEKKDDKKETTKAGESKSGDKAKGAGVKGTFAGGGASTQKVAFGAWKNAFEKANDGATVSYDPVGSGGGRKNFVSKAFAFAGSDAPLKEEQLEKAKERCGGEVIEIPVYISPIAIAFKLEGVKSLNMSAPTLAKVFSGKIKTWDDAAIKKENPDAKLPSTKITAVHRSDKSGTTENFTEYLSQAAPKEWTKKPSGKWPLSGGEAAKGTSGVSGALSETEGAIGYLDASQAADMSKVAVKVGEEYVKMSAEAAAKIVAAGKQLEGRGKYDYALKLPRDTKESGNYPVVLVSYAIACTKYDKPEEAKLVQAWLKYIVSEEGQKLANEKAKSAPIADSDRKKAMKAIEAIETK